MARLDDELLALEMLSKTELKERWARLTGNPVPRANAGLLRLAVSWSFRRTSLAGCRAGPARFSISSSTARRRPAPQRPACGCCEHGTGALTSRPVDEHGVIRWNERDWRSLNQVSRAITDTRWSGPAFFSLKRKVAT